MLGFRVRVRVSRVKVEGSHRVIYLLFHRRVRKVYISRRDQSERSVGDIQPFASRRDQ